MPDSPAMIGFEASKGLHSTMLGNSAQGSTSHDHRTGALNPVAASFSPNPALYSLEKLPKAQTKYDDSPMTMKELTHDVAVLAEEVLKLKREKMAIEESLKKVSWRVTFRPAIDSSGKFKTQTLDAHAFLSVEHTAGYQNGSLDLEDQSVKTEDNEPKSSIEDPAHYRAGWMPLAVRRFAPLSTDKTSLIPDASKMETFSFDFLQAMLGGEEYSPSFYYTPLAKRTLALPLYAWYAMDERFEPYLPERPGVHGAKLTAFFNEDIDEDDDEGPSYENIPVFVRASKWLNADNSNLFVYYGSYSQSRWSDKLDYDRMVEAVPNDVKMYWAELLTSPARPEWLTDALMKHFWPSPQYEGALSSGDAETDKVARKDMEKYMKSFKAWQKESNMKVKMLKKENILEAFETADADQEPGLRMYWEYLQCIDWDPKFYAALVKRKGMSVPL